MLKKSIYIYIVKKISNLLWNASQISKRKMHELEAKEWEETQTNPLSESIVLKLGPARWVDRGPSRPEAGARSG